MKTIFEQAVSEKIIDRLNELKPTTSAKWRTMNVAQILERCNRTHEMIYEPEKHPKQRGFKCFIVKLFVKPLVVGDTIYKKTNPLLQHLSLPQNVNWNWKNRV
jgi:hypothetical protein